MPDTKKKKQTAPPPAGPRRPRLRKSTTAHDPSEHDIASRAYQLFIQRGGEHGRDVDDWLLAKRELLSADR